LKPSQSRPTNPTTLKDSEHNQPLHLAAQIGLTHLAAFLIAQGADVDAANAQLNTPLALACKQGELPVARVLLDHGAGVDHPGKGMWTPLMLASSMGHYDLVVLLLVRGANFQARADHDDREKLGRNALEIAKLARCQETANVLSVWPVMRVLWVFCVASQVPRVAMRSRFQGFDKVLCMKLGTFLA
jgi:ankyrin repeat protein